MKLTLKYFDTNILIHSVVNQDEAKRKLSQKLITSAVKDKSIVISTLSIQEFVFVLNKLNLAIDVIDSRANFFIQFVDFSIDKNIIAKAISLCAKMKNYKNINDAVHLCFAEKYCEDFVTFDKDFKKLLTFSELNIQILK
ncbi:MAG: PIN domain-containing protein [Ignavibacteriota bacterium]